MKNNLDVSLRSITAADAFTTLTVGTSIGDMVITVADGSIFPTNNFLIMVNMELISIASRSGNILTVASNGRGQMPSDWQIYPTQPTNHGSGSIVWKWQSFTGYVELMQQCALMTQLGAPEYALRGRWLFNKLIAFSHTFTTAKLLNSNYDRWYWGRVALGYDWLYDSFTPAERAVYADAIRQRVQIQLQNGYEQIHVNGRPSLLHAGVVANIANGQLRSALMGAIASYGDNPDALKQYGWAMQKVDDWLIPSLSSGGNAARGVTIEGSEYNAETWHQTFDMLDMITTADGGRTSRYGQLFDEIAPLVVDYFFHATTPGSSTSTSNAIATGFSKSTTLDVTSTEGWLPYQGIRILLDTAPGATETYIVAIKGKTFALRDPLPTAVTAKPVFHISRFIPWGDALEANTSSMYADSLVTGGHVEAALHALDHLRISNPRFSGYIRYWLDNIAGFPGTPADMTYMKFMYYDPAIAALDYRTFLPTSYSSAEPGNTGLMSDRSSWRNDATWVTFFVGGERWDHVHSHNNSYAIWRKGVWLSSELPGYAVDPYPGAWRVPNEGKYYGGRYHNTILMNLHGAANGHSAVEGNGPASVIRYATTAEYIYARGDASRLFQGDWTSVGYSSNAANGFVRDFLYIKPDLVAVMDRTSYTTPSRSQTTWITQFRGDPIVSGLRIISEYGNQKVVQDVVVPPEARIAKVNQVDEYPDLAKWPTPVSYRIETTSGAVASIEQGFQIIQTMDSESLPLGVNRLNATGANVAQIGQSFVIGVVERPDPRPNITYSYTGSPTHYLIGFTPSTNYHVVNAGGSITVSVATGSGDMGSTTAGLLIIQGSGIAPSTPPGRGR